MVALKAKDKRPIEAEKRPEEIPIFCFMYDKSYLLDDELVDAWSPQGCARRAVAYDLELPTGWEYHGQFLLCPSCQQRWLDKYGKEINVSALMSGDE